MADCALLAANCQNLQEELRLKVKARSLTGLQMHARHAAPISQSFSPFQMKRCSYVVLTQIEI
jgi:hypothetical protein